MTIFEHCVLGKVQALRNGFMFLILEYVTCTITLYHDLPQPTNTPFQITPYQSMRYQSTIESPTKIYPKIISFDILVFIDKLLIVYDY